MNIINLNQTKKYSYAITENGIELSFYYPEDTHGAWYTVILPKKLGDVITNKKPSLEEVLNVLKK